VEPISDEALAHMEAWIAQGVPFHVSAARTAALIARLRAAEERAVDGLSLPEGYVRIDGKVYEVTSSWRARGFLGGELRAALVPLPATPEEDDDGE